MPDKFIKEDHVINIDTEERFIYEVLVYIRFENRYAQVNKKYFASRTKINYVESYFIDKYIELFTIFHSAPKRWLIDNGYVPYTYPKKQTKKKKDEQKTGSIEPETPRDASISTST